MTIEDILAGESKNVEFKAQRPDKGIKYMKSVVAFANGKGGRIVFGIDDKTRDVVGVPEDQVFQALLMPFRIAVSRLLFLMSICKISTERQL